jgi:hypothetical protein
MSNAITAEVQNLKFQRPQGLRQFPSPSPSVFVAVSHSNFLGPHKFFLEGH